MAVTRRAIPSIDRILQRPRVAALVVRAGHDAVVAAARRAADQLRARLDAGTASASSDEDSAAAWIETTVCADLDATLMPSLVPVINATGVIIHTNLGRAPLADAALDRLRVAGAGYTNLEYDLAAGARGHRHVHAEALLRHVTGAEAALVANNNAAAMLLVLAALAAGREVIVSRGELVEIGGGFRVPDILAQSGATLREVGTTNRTRTADYAAAISDRTALLLRVHPSNFRAQGFTERPALDDLVALARRFDLPLVEDLGSGWIGIDDPPPGLEDEPSVRASVRAGVDLVAFSGDKLLGGPQAGLVVGRRDRLEPVRRHPLMRAVRADKLTYTALEATLALWATPGGANDVPVYRMLTMTAAEIAQRAQAFAAGLADEPRLTCRLVDSQSTPGGGSAPGVGLPTTIVLIAAAGLSADALEGRLRRGRPPVISRIVDGHVGIDLRTVPEGDLSALATAVRQALV